MLFDQSTSQPYFWLAFMNMSGVLAFCLHKIGHGRIEDMPGLLWNLAAVVSGPLMFFGPVLLVVNVWALFALNPYDVLLTLFVSHLVWGAVCWFALGWARAFGGEDVVHALGIPLVLALRFTCIFFGALLIVRFWIRAS